MQHQRSIVHGGHQTPHCLCQSREPPQRLALACRRPERGWKADAFTQPAALGWLRFLAFANAGHARAGFSAWSDVWQSARPIGDRPNENSDLSNRDLRASRWRPDCHTNRRAYLQGSSEQATLDGVAAAANDLVVVAGARPDARMLPREESLPLVQGWAEPGRGQPCAEDPFPAQHAHRQSVLTQLSFDAHAHPR
jgi:hypothetical protein